MLAWKACLLVALLCIQTTLQYETEANLSNHKLSGLIQWKYEKRPFCNAFTGCGKKRTDVAAFPPYPLVNKRHPDVSEQRTQLPKEEEMAEDLGELIDINAEPAVQNVQQQIMSQAKLFEAIKEASKEIFRQKNKQRQRAEENKLQLRADVAEGV